MRSIKQVFDNGIEISMRFDLEQAQRRISRTFKPLTKNVAFTLLFLSRSRRAEVYAQGPSSKVRATVPGTVQRLIIWPYGMPGVDGATTAFVRRPSPPASVGGFLVSEAKGPGFSRGMGTAAANGAMTATARAAAAKGRYESFMTETFQLLELTGRERSQAKRSVFARQGLQAWWAMRLQLICIQCLPAYLCTLAHQAQLTFTSSVKAARKFGGGLDSKSQGGSVPSRHRGRYSWRHPGSLNVQCCASVKLQLWQRLSPSYDLASHKDEHLAARWRGPLGGPWPSRGPIKLLS